MSRDEIIAALGADYEWAPTGAEGWLEGMEYKELGLTFGYFEDEGLLFIDCSPDFEIFGVQASTMSFAQIMEILGEAEIMDTWIETPDHPAYTLEYEIGGSIYQFISFEPDGGDGSWLYISRA